jgi:predicted  nucleic acid-binding Zn-ribbon protein
MTSAADLFGLQEIDLTRDSRRALIADIDSRMGESEELVAARELVQTTQAEFEALRREQRELDNQLQDLDAKIAPLEKKLYDGSVRNPKELTDLQKEVELLRQRRSALDDQGLSLIDNLEAAAKAQEDAESRLLAVEHGWREDVAELTATRERAEREMARLNEERQRRTAGMDTSALGLYESLRTKKSGRAVARIERGACQGCRLSLPTHIAQRARSASALVQCPSCERVLVSG